MKKEVEKKSTEELQLIIDDFQRKNKKLLNENTEYSIKIKNLKSKILELESEVTEFDSLLSNVQEQFLEQIANLKLEKEEVNKNQNLNIKYKKFDIVCYLEKYQRLNFKVMGISGINSDGVTLYRLHADNGDILEPFVLETKLKTL